MQQQSGNLYPEDKPVHIIGPNGSKLTLEDLPPIGTTRWVIRRKAEVIAAVKGNLLTREQAIDRYDLSNEEFESWLAHVDKHGIKGLKTTRTGHYRKRKRDNY